MNDTAVHEAPLAIPRTHPSLPGHFPGRPIVPAVVLLDAVLSEAERWLGRPLAVRSLSQAKFSTPLLPDESACLRLRLNHGELRFSIAREDTTVAQGIFGIEAETGG